MKRLDIDHIRRILIRSANWVGDTIMMTPAVRAIRKCFPAAEISILAKPWVAPVFFNSPHIDHILIYDDADRHAGWRGKQRLCKALRKKKFDLAVLFQNAFEAAFLAFGASIPNRVGYTTDGRSLLLTHRVRRRRTYKQHHQIDYYLGILEGVGLARYGDHPALFLSEKERLRAQELLEPYGITQSDSIIGINPGAVYGTAKRWMPERYAALCDKLSKSHDVKMVIFGGPGEEGLGEKIGKTLAGRCIDFCGKTSLREAMALIERCRLFITNDSGLMHVAAALDRPLVAIFGSTDPVTTGPYGVKSRIVRTPMKCSPCLKTDCTEDHQCMKKITVDMVYREAETLIDKDG